MKIPKVALIGGVAGVALSFAAKRYSIPVVSNFNTPLAWGALLVGGLILAALKVSKRVTHALTGLGAGGLAYSGFLAKYF